MNPDTPVILMVGHGSPRREANDGFVATVGRIAVRLGVPVLPTFFSLARPGIEDQVARLAGNGVRRIVLMPYFLYTGRHVSRDIPALLEACRARHPGLRIEVLPTLEGEAGLEDVVVDRLLPYVVPGGALPADGRTIERRSHEIIESHLGRGGPQDPAERAILRRVIHATADFSFARSLRIHPEAVRRGREALGAGKPVLCDVRMLQAGITRTGGQVLCAVGDPQTLRLAREQGSTRAAAAMEVLRDKIDGAIVAIGNAPTALGKVLEIAAGGGPRPALVVGLPVGLVGARESKLALLASGLCYITNTGARGGSPVAAAAVNALAVLAKESDDA
jgi:precorrin-8X/cobalt-precorrin-8 methylmutase